MPGLPRSFGATGKQDVDGRVKPGPDDFSHSARKATSVQSLVSRLEIALAVIAALGAARRAVAGILFLIAGARLLAAGALHQHAAALAVADQPALAGRLDRFLAARRLVPIISFVLFRPREIGAGKFRDTLAELLPQHPRLHLLDLAFGEFAELERPVGDADQPVH